MVRFLTLITFIFILAACNEEEVYSEATSLEFSADTLLFDTVFTSVGSFTQRLKVYNPSNKGVTIKNLALAGGSSSYYGLVVNGDQANDFEDIQLLPKDSLLILVNVEVDPSDEDLPFIVKDSIVFSSAGNLWDVDLIAWGQDAYFYSDSIIPCNTVWTADRPYVIYNSILIDTPCQLTIEAGTKVYSHPGSSIFVRGTLLVEGSPENRVLFSNDRLDEGFRNASGQWGGLSFLEGSDNNIIQYTDIRNAVNGIRVGTPDDNDDADLQLLQTRVENMSGYGVLAFTSDISAENVLINNCRLGGFAGLAGGNYSILNSTIANYPIGFLFDGPALVLGDNVLLANDEVLEADLAVSLANTVVWGISNDEILLSETGNNLVSFDFENNLLKTTNTSLGLNSLYNEVPDFTGPQEYNYLPISTSILIDRGADLGIIIDLFGNGRSTPPDIGAIEFQ